MVRGKRWEFILLKRNMATQTIIGELARNYNYLYHNRALISTYCMYHKMGEDEHSDEEHLDRYHRFMFPVNTRLQTHWIQRFQYQIELRWVMLTCAEEEATW